MSACPDAGLLQQLLTEELDAGAREALEEHLAGCTVCQQQLEILTSDADQVRWRRQQAEGSASASDHDRTLFRRVAALGASFLDVSGPKQATDQLADTLRLRADTINAPAPQPEFPTVPGYEILAEVGRGGMAVVYRARQKNLGRIVALKMILAGPHAAERERTILRAEAQAIAGLLHPHIVQIYEVGEHEQQLYLSLEFVEGGNLAQCLAGAPQPPRAAAALAAELARAVHFAHERGIVHRDLKPSNILLSFGNDPSTSGNRVGLSDASPKIADFGLAKRLDDAMTLFASGAVVGTPSYMAPEQARARARVVGPATDVYALGAILYECLTGRPPFRAETAYETLLQVVHEDPVSPRQLQPTVPRDLENICLKCLHKDSRCRYQSAHDLADDLDRFGNGQPVKARPVGPVARVARWIRRQPTLAALLGTVIVLTVAAFGLLLWQLDSAEGRAAADKRATDEAGKREAEERRARREAERLTAGAIFDKANALCERGDVGFGLMSFASGLELAEQAGDDELAHVFRINLTAWHTRFVRLRASFKHTSLVYGVAYNRTGDLAATASDDRKVQIWEVATGNRSGEPLLHDGPVLCVAFSPDGKTLLSGGTAGNGGSITQWDLKTRQPLRRWATSARMKRLTFTPNGDRFVALTQLTAHLFDPASDKPLADLSANEEVLSVVISPDGQTVVTGDANGVVRRWDIHAASIQGDVLAHPDSNRGRVEAVAFSPDGKTIAAAARVAVADDLKQRVVVPMAKVWLWDAETAAPRSLMLQESARILALAFSDDSRLLATGSVAQDFHADKKTVVSGFGEARIYEVATGRQMGPAHPHPLAVMSLAFSPDGSLLLTGSEDGKARLFSVACGQQIGGPLEHEGAVMSLAFSPDGRTALTGSAGGFDFAAGRLWELPAGGVPQMTFPGRTLPERSLDASLTFSPDGDLLLMSSPGDRVVHRWKVVNGLAAGDPLPHSPGTNALAFSKDGKTLVGSGKDKQLRLWDRSGQEQKTLSQHAEPSRLAISPDGRTIVTEAGSKVVCLWDAVTGKPRGQFPHKGNIRVIVCPAADHALWYEHDEPVIRVWKWTEASGVQQLWQQPINVWTGCFDPSARTLLIGGEDRCPRLLDALTGQPLGTPLPRQNSTILVLALAADGRTAVLGCSDGVARLWDAVLARPLGPPLRHPTSVTSVAFCPRSPLLAVADGGGAYLWPIPQPMRGSPREILLRTQALTGLSLNARAVLRESSSASPRTR